MQTLLLSPQLLFSLNNELDWIDTMSTILSPLPGTFYIRANPESEPYKKAGDAVAIGDVIGLVEVMKTFIEIKSEVEGAFSIYSVEDAKPVTAGQTLAELEG